jgi:hypothetical protein
MAIKLDTKQNTRLFSLIQTYLTFVKLYGNLSKDIFNGSCDKLILYDAVTVDLFAAVSNLHQRLFVSGACDSLCTTALWT